jgi:glycosyltransferase involved in cell wall biosynthesis
VVITWPEPFGLVMAEALAAATPVLTFPNGAAPEMIDHGRTGYLCRYEDEMTAATARTRDRPPAVPGAAERRFSLPRMAAAPAGASPRRCGSPRASAAVSVRTC